MKCDHQHQGKIAVSVAEKGAPIVAARTKCPPVRFPIKATTESVVGLMRCTGIAPKIMMDRLEQELLHYLTDSWQLAHRAQKLVWKVIQ